MQSADVDRRAKILRLEAETLIDLGRYAEVEPVLVEAGALGRAGKKVKDVFGDP